MKTHYESFFKKPIAGGGGLEKYISLIFTFYGLLLITLVLLLAIPFGYLLKLFQKPKDEIRLWNSVFKKCAVMIISIAGLRVKVEGCENIPREGPVVFAANHTSHIDAVMIGAILDLPIFAMIMPAEKFPFVYRFWLRKSGCVEVVRDETEEKKYPKINKPQKALEISLEKIKNGNSLLVFPEGHIERVEKVLYFHTGTARMALSSRVPIIPITIEGANKAFPMRTMMLDPQHPITFHFSGALNISKFYGQEDNHEIVKKITWLMEEKVLRELPKKYIGVDIIRKIPEKLAHEKNLDRRKIKYPSLTVLKLNNYRGIEIRQATEKINWYPRRHSKVAIKLTSNANLHLVKHLVNELSLSDCQINLHGLSKEQLKKAGLEGYINVHIPKFFLQADHHINLATLKIPGQLSIPSEKSQAPFPDLVIVDAIDSYKLLIVGKNLEEVDEKLKNILRIKSANF